MTTRWRMLQAWLHGRPLAADSLLAAGLGLFQLGLWSVTPADAWPRGFMTVLILTAVEMGFVAIRRRWPWVAVVGLSVFAVASVLWHGLEGGSGFGLLVLAYTAAAYQRLRPALLATVVLWTPVLVVAMSQPDTPAYFEDLPRWYLLTWNVLVAAVCFCLGRVIHSRRAVTAALESRARTAEANQQALAEQAVAEERRRIARELHDVVAHHVAVMGVLATGARRTAARDPAAADQALTTIEETGRTALRELRRLLDVLRTDAEPAGELAPQPGLGGIDALVEQVREAGLPVTLTTEGEPGPLDPGVALTVYRVVQEALTNVLKHAGPASAEVRIGHGAAWLVVEVFDTGRGPRPGAEAIGHGLISMRERVALYGGSLRTGPRPGGGFRVYARIPADQMAERT